MKRILVSCLIFMLFAEIGQAQQQAWFDESKTIEQRVDMLIEQMTLDEKVGQMMNNAPAIERLGIPKYDWWNECLHGVGRAGLATVYPQAIGLAATFDEEALFKSANIISDEARAKHHEFIRENSREIYQGLTYWSPNINIFRDPRWGRGQETYGEDPYLTARMGVAFVKGLQGNDSKYYKLVATAKHFAVHSGPEYERHTFDAHPTNYDLWATYLPAFKALVSEAKVASVMCAYNRLDGTPCCGSNALQVNILRSLWKFNGYIVSDCGAIDDFYKTHRTSPDAATASTDAVRAGTDLECGESYRSLKQAIEQGLIDEKELDISLKRLFYARFKLGMFDSPQNNPYAKIPYSVVDSEKHRNDALEMARKSIVLLKNENKTLPLSKSLRKLAVVGPGAADSVAILGNYNGTPGKRTTILEGITDKCKKNNIEVIYRKAINLLDDSVIESIDNGIKKKTNYAQLISELSDVDAIIFVGGISPILEGEEMPVNLPGFKKGDRTTIALPTVQTQAMKELKNIGKPIIFVIQTGSAISINWEDANIPAILNAWYGGQAIGAAVSDVLFGDYNPAGRLPVTFYKSDNDLPPYEDYSMTGRTYRYFKQKPLYPFGHGLSYTSFEYSNLKVNRTNGVGGNISVSVNIENTGAYDGEEVTQLYIKHKNATELTPVTELKGFKRIFLKKEQKENVSFVLTPDDLCLLDKNGNKIHPSGEVLIFIGGGQPDFVKNGKSAILKY